MDSCSDHLLSEFDEKCQRSYWDLWLLIETFANLSTIQDTEISSETLQETRVRLWSLFLRRNIWEAGDLSRSLQKCKISCFIIVAWPSWVSETLWKTLHICVIAFTDSRNTVPVKTDLIFSGMKRKDRNNSPAERTRRF